jgi:hypothetical protein
MPYHTRLGVGWSVLVLLVTATSSFAAADAPAPANSTTVTLKRLMERRELAVEKTPFSGWESGVELSVHVDGPAAAGARKYGKLKVTEAKDDAGTDLTQKPKGVPTFESEQFREVREPNSFTGFGRQQEDKPKPTGFDLDIRLYTVPARQAKTLSVVRGEMVVLVGGEKKIVELKSILQHYNKPIEDPALKAVGVTFTMLDPQKKAADLGVIVLGGGDKKKSVPVQIAGNVDAVASVKFVDKSGKELNQGSMSQNGQPADKRTITYELSQPVSDDVTLQIEVWPGQKTVKVPFELKDVKLP